MTLTINLLQATLQRERGQGASDWEAGATASTLEAALFRVRIVEKRMRINEEQAALKLRALDTQLRSDPRLCGSLGAT